MMHKYKIKTTMLNKAYLYPILIACLLLSACTKEQAGKDYKTEALAVCEVFNPDNWKDTAKDIEPYELQDLLSKRLSAAIKTDEMQEIMANISKIKPEFRYEFYKDSVSQLLGEPHECPAIKNYFTY